MGILEIVLGIYCFYFISYSALFTLTSFFYSKNTIQKKDFYQIAVLVPAYRCDEVILNTVKRNLNVSYPKEYWKLFVIADGLSKDTIRQLQNMPVEVVEVQFEQSTKVRSLKKCMEHPELDRFSHVVILDADNLMKSDFLEQINRKLERQDSVQGKRVASNHNNTLAILDGISESLNIVNLRKGPEVLGLSVSLNGSGMAFKKEPFKDVLQSMDSIGGFDRELEYELLDVGVRSSYLDEAVVYDEKTDEMANFKNQRRRWLSSHFYYLRKYFGRGVNALMRGKFIYFHSTVLRNIQLPRSMNIGLITLLTGLSLVLSLYDIWHWQQWLTLWLANVVITMVAIPRSYYNKDLVKAVIRLPGIILSFFLLLFNLKGANKKFIHTAHKVRNDQN